MEQNTSAPANKSAIAGWLRILILIVPYSIVVGLFELLGTWIAGGDLSEIAAPQETPIQILITQLCTTIATLLVLFFMMKWVDKEPFVNLGFQWKNRKKEVVRGAGMAFLMIIIGFLGLYSAGFVHVKTVNINATDLLIIILLYILVAINEEVLLRGYVLRNLMRSMNKYAALAISSLLFSVMHLANPDFSWFTLLSLFLAGIWLGASYIYTQNLWFPIGLHFGWNFMQSIMGFNVSGLDTYSLLETSPVGKEYISGGAFGFEGSIVSLPIMTVCIIGIFIFFSKKEKNQTMS